MDTQLTEKIKALASKYRMDEIDGGRLRVRVNGKSIAKEDDAFIVANKPAILNWLREKKAKKDAIKNAILEKENKWKQENGVNAIEAAMDARAEWENAFQAAMDRGDGVLPAPFAGPTPEDVMKQYPVGAAYVRMASWIESEDDRKSCLGRRACRRLMDGEDPAHVLAYAEKAWTDAAMRAVMGS